jgi:hypothetical protein
MNPRLRDEHTHTPLCVSLSCISPAGEMNNALANVIYGLGFNFRGELACNLRLSAMGFQSKALGPQCLLEY